MNILKTLGLSALFAGILGVSDADARPRHRGHHANRPNIEIIVNGYNDFTYVNPYVWDYQQIPPSPYYHPYHHSYYRSNQIMIPIGNNGRLYINLNDVRPNHPHNGYYYPQHHRR